ncbi:N-acetylglucosamine-1-phosphodiester alpha-N-acetylglucosaminidase [Phyllostomus discolor]|nr:N-acetylglucosamine-1-phosphodiester alpha-N-acetylglucosaminidase [Phyllostomus discolor]
MAEFLLKQDVVNAINLDGGGSATFVLNGTLASYPSDHCQDNMWRCPRSVSTVVCVHKPRCQPPDCNSHGTCVEGHCQCTGHFWSGAACDKLECGPSNCSQHGLCTETCSNGSFGEDCAKKCQCQNGATCDPVLGTCTCPPGFTGDSCVQECPLGWHGPGCQKPCECEHQCPCNPQTGNCNLTQTPTLSSILSRVKQCLQPSEVPLQTREFSLLTGTTWLALTLVLVFLLLISMVVNVSLLLSARAERSRHLDGSYVYHPLQEMNGELSAEKEQQGDACTSFKD